MTRTQLRGLSLVSDKRLEFLATFFTMAQVGIILEFVVPNDEAQRSLRQVLESYRLAEGIALPPQAHPRAKDAGANATVLGRSINATPTNLVYFVTDESEARILAPRVSQATFIVHDFSSIPHERLLQKTLLAVVAPDAALLKKSVFRALEHFDNIRVADQTAFNNLEQQLADFRKFVEAVRSAA